MRFICKFFGHKMYNISWDAMEFSVICTRCEKYWTHQDRIGSHHE